MFPLTEGFTYFYTKVSPFSQFHPARITLHFGQQPITFNTAEQAMMYRKALLFNDVSVAQQILGAKTPAAAKKLGRQVSPFNPTVWDQHKRDIVYTNNYAKFTQNPHLYQQLMATGKTRLVEASPKDTVWGVGLSASDPRIADPANWRGQNLLGDILTQLREDLKREERKRRVNLIEDSFSLIEAKLLLATDEDQVKSPERAVLLERMNRILTPDLFTSRDKAKIIRMLISLKEAV